MAERAEDVPPEMNGKMDAAVMVEISEAPATAPSTPFKAERQTPLMRQRDVMEKERTGELRFETITNDGRDQTMIELIALKNIFAKQLPKMPKEYIVRLVLDRNHYSLVCLSGGDVVGGITYRPHFTQGFAEIAFCAVTAARQVKGFGTRMMNQLKQIVKKDGIEYFLTYADNYAIGYFKKQGFNRQVTMKRERWVGYIKDYDGGTLMECPLSEHVDYTNLPKMIEEQRKALLVLIAQRLPAAAVFPPLTNTLTFETYAEGDIRGSKLSITSAEHIPGLAETGFVMPRYTYRVNGEASTLSLALKQVLEELLRSEHVWPFLQPVDVAEAPDYYEIINQPMDLNKIQRRIAIGYYRTLRLFEADVRRVVSNCRSYNGEDNQYALCAGEIDKCLNHTLTCVEEVRVDPMAVGAPAG
ncbi:hypothetical protein T492DRAFT_1033783 [Pavlovales sp. CCMP2436]|nr:hypothetical protein T492DRAFT_1033783 [Pavlovales sp. CCMP2436]|mmetsp:Transcript_3307/g.8706  ORF Transcript_3307/g.8706 Transcript_3307/m.8706 type:complete len:414 (+) Transcript_3307:23-1264(+)